MEAKEKLKTDGGINLADLLDKPSLRALSYALRHPDTWPEDFVWDYNNCTNCAIGLAKSLWHSGPPANQPIKNWNEANHSWVSRFFGVPFSEAKKIFFHANWQYRTLGIIPRSMESVTPEMVADLIDGYLAKAE